MPIMNTPDPNIGSRNWTQLVVVEAGVPVRIDNTPLVNWKTDSGERPTDEWLATQGYWGLISTEPPAVDPRQEWCRQVPVSEWLVDEASHTVLMSWEIVPWTQQEQAQQLEQQWGVFRSERNQRLADSDWTQLADTSASVGAAWLMYRQALRDLPSNTEDPYNPQWPIPPSAED